MASFPYAVLLPLVLSCSMPFFCMQTPCLLYSASEFKNRIQNSQYIYECSRIVRSTSTNMNESLDHREKSFNTSTSPSDDFDTTAHFGNHVKTSSSAGIRPPVLTPTLPLSYSTHWHAIRPARLGVSLELVWTVSSHLTSTVKILSQVRLHSLTDVIPPLARFVSSDVCTSVFLASRTV